MKIYIVEDEIFHLEDMLISLEHLGYEAVGHSTDAFEAQEQIETLMPDVVLMDITLNGKKSGINLAKRLTEKFGILIIFTTSETGIDTINRAVEINPITYLTKPIKEQDLKAALILAQSKFNNKKNQEELSFSDDTLFIKNGNKIIKVNIDDILFAHTDTKNYCTVVTNENKKLSVRHSILGLHKLLDNSIFVQTHRSYIINWSKINFFYDADQTIDIEGHSIPIGRTFKKEIYQKLNIL